MSGLLPFAATIAQAAADGLLGPIIVRQRNIGGFVADVTVREIHDDELGVSENPVEQGADITEHAFKKPARLRVLCAYSNSSPQADGDSNYVQEAYENFLGLQANLQPFDVVTGKRLYTDMVIRLLHTETDEKTENALFLEVDLMQIIIVQTQAVSVPPNANMNNPAANGASANLGLQSLGSANNINTSVLPESGGYNAIAESVSP